MSKFITLQNQIYNITKLNIDKDKFTLSFHSFILIT